MSRQDTSRRFALLMVSVAGAAALAGCGKQGALERPGPLFGSRARAEYEAERAQEARDEAQRSEQRANEGTATGPAQEGPPTTRDVLDPNQRLNPASAAPVPGAPNPFGSPVSPTGR